MSAIEVTTQAQLDKALKNLKPGDYVACIGGSIYSPLVVSGSAHVEAWESAHVVARESAHVVARESAHVAARESAHVAARESAHVVAWGSAHVVAWESAHVVARESAHVVAWGSAHVVASPYVAVTKQTSHRGTISGGVIIEIPEITTAEQWIDFHGLTVKRGLVTLYKAVDDDWKSGYGFAYTPGSKPKCDDWDPHNGCGNGLHFTAHPLISKSYMQNATQYVACPVKVVELVVIDNEKVKAPRVAGAIFEVGADREPIAERVAA
jgi:hypothetical protein